MLYICVDGTGVPVIAAETEGRRGKGEDGAARTREVKLCCCFTQTSIDEQGRPARDPRSSSYLVTFAPAAQFGVLTAAEARRRGAGRIRQLVFPGDGATWIWKLAARHFPEATQIVDLYHAREHLHDLARLLEFMLGASQQHWLAARLTDLDDDVDLRAHSPADRVPISEERTANDVLAALERDFSLPPKTIQDQLRGFLAGRVSDAQEKARAAGDPDWRARLAEKLDYRLWFELRLEYRTAHSGNGSSGGWRALYRGDHGVLSQGAKVVTLMQPFIAALHAMYDQSAIGPRMIWLDEAFGGVDSTKTRPPCSGC